jgi:hypothetical protein
MNKNDRGYTYETYVAIKELLLEWAWYDSKDIPIDLNDRIRALDKAFSGADK